MGESVKVVEGDKGRKKHREFGEVNQVHSEIRGVSATKKKKYIIKVSVQPWYNFHNN